MNDQAGEVKRDDQSASVTATLAAGGGNATAAGVTFQGALGALFAARAIADRPLRRAGSESEPFASRNCASKTEAPLDDIMIATDRTDMSLPR